MVVRLKEVRLRKAAARRQGLRCHYCDARMWLGEPREFLQRHGIEAAQARRFQCTAEHLLPRHAGGANRPHNVVAACAFCNLSRNQFAATMSAQAYRDHVRGQVAQGRWHPPWAVACGICDPS